MNNGLAEYNPQMESFEYEFESENSESGVFNESEEMELAAELLEVRDEAELEQFLGSLFKKIGSGLNDLQIAANDGLPDSAQPKGKRAILSDSGSICRKSREGKRRGSKPGALRPVNLFGNRTHFHPTGRVVMELATRNCWRAARCRESKFVCRRPCAL